MLTYWCHNGVLWFKLKNNFEMMSQGGQTLFWSSALGWIYLYFFPYFDRFVYGTSRIQQYDHRHWSAQSVKTMWTSQSETVILLIHKPLQTKTSFISIFSSEFIECYAQSRYNKQTWQPWSGTVWWNMNSGLFLSKSDSMKEYLFIVLLKDVELRQWLISFLSQTQPVITVLWSSSVIHP